uniref:Protein DETOXIFICATION n=1 Tax=Rhizophora mucronata TaxID=61149 RepID=A0A2P2NP69_RHIMU
MPVAVRFAFFAGLDFEGLWLGLLAAQGSCVVTMLVVLSRTDWEFEAQRAKQLTEAAALVVSTDDQQEIEENKPPEAEIKKDFLYIVGGSKENDYNSLV